MTTTHMDHLITVHDQFALFLHRIDSQQLICTAHPVITDDTGRSLIREGHFVSEGDLRLLLQSLCGDTPDQRLSLLPYGTLAYIPGELLIWHVPGKHRPMWFHNDEGKTRLDVPWPDLILAASRDGLNLAALPSGTRPEANSLLHHAPLMNVGNDTRLCLGNARAPDVIGPESTAEWEALVFDTCFSHVNHQHTLRLGRGDIDNAEHLRFWLDLHEKKARRFPKRRLVPLGMTLGEWAGVIAST